MVRGKSPILIVRGWVAVVIPPAIRTVKLDVPAVVGFPEITPVSAASDRPAGSEPADIDQV
jgi:hypothetical protein